MLKKVKKSLLENKLLLLILAIASFARLYRLSDLLGFWYDQGRDALVIWDFIHNGKVFLIGPTTGIAGIFRGPWYYWLITPFYFIGKGNPLYPSVFLVITTVIAIFILYKIGVELGGKKTGLMAAFIASLSYNLINSSRWLSNPTPMLLIGISLIWGVFRFIEGKKWALPLIAFLVGLSLNFGSAMEIFYIPSLLIIFIWKRNKLPDIRIMLLSTFLFLFTFFPLILFEIRHRGVLSGAIFQFLFKENSFSVSIGQLIASRLSLYYSVFTSQIWSGPVLAFTPFLLITFIFLYINRKIFLSNNKFISLLIIALAPFIGGLFFSGNKGNVYGYYFTGYFMIFILFFSFMLSSMWDNRIGKLFVLVFLGMFIYQNIYSYTNFYVFNKRNNYVSIGSQLKAIDWIYKEAKNRPFNVDEYVPPVIPYSYEYLFKWLGNTKYGTEPLTKNVNLLYTLYESDPDHPERLDAWLSRQKGIGKIEKEQAFDNIIVQERLRIN